MADRRRTGLRILTGGSILLVLGVLMAIGFPPMEVLEERLFDLRMSIRGPLPAPPQVVVAAIDEKSVREIGRWPWSRDKLAAFVDALGAAGAEIVAFDVILSESEINDPLLAASMARAGNVFLPLSFLFDGDTGNGLCPPGSGYTTVLQSSNRPVSFYTATGVSGPVAALAEQAMNFGHINIVPDRDGTVRREVLAVRYGDAWYPSLGLQAAAFFLGVPAENIKLDTAGNLLVGSRSIPVDDRCRTVINYYGAGLTFPHIPVSDILTGKAGKESLEGKIVLVGATAPGLYDLRVTPFSAAFPGVEKHANVIASILEKRFLKKAPLWQDISILLASCAILVLCLARMRAMQGTIAASIILAAVVISNYILFARYGLWLNAAYPSTGIVTIFLGVTAMNYVSEERHARKIRSMFSSYVTARVVDELIKNPEMAKLGGDRREVTVLFSDVRGFTSLSEKMSPEDLVSQLNEYLSSMTDVIFRWEGTLDKFIGDAIVAFWGAPMAQENHAELAVRCALHMGDALTELQKKWAAEGKMILDSGIGINTGEVLVGNIGAEGRKMDYTVIGDHVNLGARVEGLTRKYDVRILVTGNTLEKIREKVIANEIGHVSVRGLERVIVKGKEKPVEIYELKSVEPSVASVITECAEGEAVRLTEK